MGHFGFWSCGWGLSLEMSWGAPSPLGLKGTVTVKLNRLILFIRHLGEVGTQNMMESLNNFLLTRQDWADNKLRLT